MGRPREGNIISEATNEGPGRKLSYARISENGGD